MICDVCGEPKDQRAYNMNLCNKHYAQYRRHGKFMTRTIYDKNEISINNDIAEIRLYDRSGNYRCSSIISCNHIDKVSNYKWHIDGNGYVVNSQGTYLHRMVLNIDNEGILVDHKDRNKLNNTDDNLRLADRSQNGMNKKVKGVYLDKRMKEGTRRWSSEITVRGKKYRLGYFYSYEDAKIARTQAEEHYFKEWRAIDE